MRRKIIKAESLRANNFAGAAAYVGCTNREWLHNVVEPFAICTSSDARLEHVNDLIRGVVARLEITNNFPQVLVGL